MLAILCSGQGHQGPGMFDLVRDDPRAAPLFDQARRLLDGHDPRDLAAERLHANRTAQILCVLAAVTLRAALSDVLPARSCVAGYSVGEVAAWSFAGLLSGEAALDLVAERAEAMDAARGRDEQGLLFVRWRLRDRLESLCVEFGVAIAIVNPDGGHVLGGPAKGLAQLADAARREGAERIVPIPVEVASHTRWMEPAEPAFTAALERLVSRSAPLPGVRLFSGIDGAHVLDVAEGQAKLVSQLSQTVRWDRCLEACHEAGATVWLETGPGNALSQMVGAVQPGGRARSASEFRSLDGLRRWLDDA